MTLFGKRMKDNRDMVKHIMGYLPSKELLINEIVLNRPLDPTLPGKYVIKVTREIFPNEGRGEPPVVANSCTFEIGDWLSC